MKLKTRNWIAIVAGLLVSGGLVGVALAQDESDVNLSPEDQGFAEADMDMSADASDMGEEDVEVTVGELQELLNQPSSSMIKEYQEDLQNPPSLFDMEDQETIKRIFGEKPRFIYFPEGVDPMVIPWVRARTIAEELFQEATVAAANQDYDKAKDVLRGIREEYPETPTAANVPKELERINRLQEEKRLAELRERQQNMTRGEIVPDRAPEPEKTEVVFPDWVTKNTTGVMLSDQPTVIVGNDFLAVGDSVPRYPTVRVKSITPSEVVFSYQNQDFTKEVDGSF